MVTVTHPTRDPDGCRNISSTEILFRKEGLVETVYHELPESNEGLGKGNTNSRNHRITFT